MQHVSCRALGILLKAAKRRDGAPALLTEGVPYDFAYLSNPKNRIEWSVFCKVLHNARKVWTLEQLSDLNEAFMRSPFFSYVGVIARLLFTSRDLFDWICKQQVGGGAQLFSNCVKASFEHIGADMTMIWLDVAPEYEVSPEFFWMTRGAFIAMPGMVRAGDADVEMTIEGRRATYRVKYKNKRGTLASLFRWLALPFTARAAGRELQRTNEELQSRFLELAAANTRVEQQATQLRTAHRINDLVKGDLDLCRTLDVVTRALVDQAGFLRAEIQLTTRADVHQRTATYGEAVEGEPIRRPLEAHGIAAIGELRVVPPSDANRQDAIELLDFVVPTLVMTIENAISYRELENYRTNLEALVDVRTTELRQARDQLEGTVVQLRDAQGAREKFFANISHEIRTPLSIILLAAADIEKRSGAKLDERAKAGLGSVTDSARKLVRLVDELLLLAAGQEDKLTTKPEPTDLAALLRSLFAAWRPGSEQAGLELTATVPEKLVVMVDPVAIERVVSNLISNAVKYTPRGGTVELQLATDAESIRISVLDSGKGISPDLASRLFGRFERAEGEDRKISGTGLGLALAKQLVEVHGGTIAHHARDVGGTEMRVTLPLALLRADAKAGATVLRLVDAAKPAPAPMVSRLGPEGLSKGTIVLAEDDARLADMIAELLSDEYIVHVGNDGAAALELVKKHQPQLLITDVDMPNMDGIELSRRFRELTNEKLAPIIILSAMMDLGTRLAGLEAGAVDYVTKPFDPIELKARVRAQFRMRDLAVRLHRAEQLSTLGVLTSSLAHELRNPANGVVNAIAPIRALLPPELTEGDAPVGQLLDVMSECAEQINMLSKQLLGFRNDANTLVLRPTRVSELVRRALSMTTRAFTEVEIRVDVPADLVVNCAPPLMLQVLTNLLENAAYAAEKAGWVEISARVASGRILLEVADSGPGVPLHLRSSVFEPFFTTKPQGVGTGLGLPVSREIVTRHHGGLDIRERGTRSVFVVELPVHSSGDVDAAAGAR